MIKEVLHFYLGIMLFSYNRKRKHTWEERNLFANFHEMLYIAIKKVDFRIIDALPSSKSTVHIQLNWQQNNFSKLSQIFEKATEIVFLELAQQKTTGNGSEQILEVSFSYGNLPSEQGAISPRPIFRLRFYSSPGSNKRGLYFDF